MQYFGPLTEVRRNIPLLLWHWQVARSRFSVLVLPRCVVPLQAASSAAWVGRHDCSGSLILARPRSYLNASSSQPPRCTSDPVGLRGLPHIHDETVDEWGTQSPGPVHDRATRPVISPCRL